MIVNEAVIERLSIGSQFLGGGGGGSAAEGLEQAREALALAKKLGKEIEILPYSEFAGKKGKFVTISGVGAPSAKDAVVTSEDFEKILTMYKEKRPSEEDAPAGILPSEMGGSSTFGPFCTAVKHGLKIVDSACDGRAHPLGTMGAMGMTEDPSYVTIQAASGGDPKKNLHVETVTEGSVNATAQIIRNTASNAGGAVAVARNPISFEQLKENSAVGCYQLAYDIGDAYLRGTTVSEKLRNAADVIHGEIICRGKVTDRWLQEKNALDAGKVTVESEDGKVYTLDFYNEYMTLCDKTADGEIRKYTFPDLIVTCGADGIPISSAFLRTGDEITLLASHHRNMILGAGLYYRGNYKQVEDALGVSLTDYNEDILRD